jgi:zinc transport system permease protein
MEFFEALQRYSFLQNALLGGILASIASGVVGTYVVTRRMTVIAGSLAHCTLGGMGLAVWLNEVHGFSLQPLHGALFAALLAAGIIAAVRLRGHEREDTIISALWAVGMAIGIVFLAQTPGYRSDLMAYLFGNPILISPAELRLLVVVDLSVVLLAVLFYRPLLAICFDEDFARVRGLPVPLLYTLLLTLCALTIVTLIYVVGVVLVIALLTLPVAIASRLARRLWHMMVLAAALSAFLSSLGLAVSYAPDLPVGAVTVLMAGFLYVLVHLAEAIRGRTR